MAARKLLVIVSIFAIALTVARPARATWSSIGNVLTAASGNQLNLQSASDGAGGVFVVWEDGRSGTGIDIYAMHFSRQGTPVLGWSTNGTVVCNAAGDQTHPVLIPDGAGGVFIAWQDHRGSNWDIRAVRMTSSGGVASGWTANGNAVCTSSGDQQGPAIASDGITGFVVAWHDTRDGANIVIYAMRILSSGDPSTTWTPNGIQVSPTLASQVNPSICATSDGSTAIAWEDATSSATVRVQKVSVIGALLWVTTGIAPFPTSYGEQRGPKLASDNSGGVFFASTITYGTDEGVYVERVTSNGGVAWVTPVNFDSIVDEVRPALVADGTGACLIAFERDPITGDPVKRVDGFRLDSSGSIVWSREFPHSSYGDPFHPTILPDGSGGGIFAWRAAAASSGAGGALEAVRLTSANAVVGGWTNPTFAMGMANSLTPTVDNTRPQMVTDGLGGMIIVTADKDHNGAADYNLYAQMVGPTGNVAPDTDPPAAVADLGTATAKFSLVVMWTAPADAPGGFSPATAYDLRISNAPLDQYTFSTGTQVATSAPQSPGTPECLTVGGLSSCTYYWLAIKSVDANGNWSAISNIANPKTKCSGVGSIACDPGLMAWRESAPAELGMRVMPTTDRSSFRCQLSLPTRQSVRLDVLDVTGRIVVTLLDGEAEEGITEARWDGVDRRGSRVGAGVYFARMLTSAGSRAAKVIIAP